MTTTDPQCRNDRECSAPGDGSSSPCRPLATDGGAADRARPDSPDHVTDGAHAAAEDVSFACSSRRAPVPLRAAARAARRAAHPLASRKVRVALATVFAAFAADRGLDLDEELITAILSVGVALILGIAHEDAGRAAGQREKSDHWRPTRGI